jgi:hypothetical protein
MSCGQAYTLRQLERGGAITWDVPIKMLGTDNGLMSRAIMPQVRHKENHYLLKVINLDIQGTDSKSEASFHSRVRLRSNHSHVEFIWILRSDVFGFEDLLPR